LTSGGGAHEGKNPHLGAAKVAERAIDTGKSVPEVMPEVMQEEEVGKR
jgi:hypothetical protein